MTRLASYQQSFVIYFSAPGLILSSLLLPAFQSLVLTLKFCSHSSEQGRGSGLDSHQRPEGTGRLAPSLYPLLPVLAPTRPLSMAGAPPTASTPQLPVLTGEMRTKERFGSGTRSFLFQFPIPPQIPTPKDLLSSKPHWQCAPMSGKYPGQSHRAPSQALRCPVPSWVYGKQKLGPAGLRLRALSHSPPQAGPGHS